MNEDYLDSKELETTSEPTNKYSFYSNLLGKVFDTVDELLLAEKEYNNARKAEIEKANIKKERAKEVEKAYIHYVDVVEKSNEDIRNAQSEYLELKNNFIKDYGSFHMTYSKEDDGKKVNKDIKITDSINSIFDVFKHFPF